MMHRFGGVIRVGLFFGRSYGAVKGFAYNGVEKEVEQKESCLCICCQPAACCMSAAAT